MFLILFGNGPFLGVVTLGRCKDKGSLFNLVFPVL